MKRTVYLGLLVVILLLATAPSSAKLNITPSIYFREEYNDNIFLTRTNREYDFITTINPAIAFRYDPSRFLDFSLDYGLNFRFYSRHSDLNDTSLSETQAIKFQNQIRPFNRVFIDISDVYKRVPVDVRREVALENVLVNMTDSNTFSISPYVKLPLTSTISTSFGYRYTNIWYRDNEAIDSDSHSAFWSLDKQFPIGVDAGLRYSYYAYRPEDSGEYDRHLGSVVVGYQMAPGFKLTDDYTVRPLFRITGEVGIASFDYENETREDKTTTFWNIAYGYELRIIKGATLEAGYGTSFHDSATAGAFKRRRFDLKFKTGKAFRLTINSYYFVDKYMETDRKDKITGVSATISRPMSKRMNASINGVWERQKFLPEDEKVQRYGVGSTLDYRVSPRITTSIGYTYNKKNSDTDTNDFYNNIVWLQAKLTF